MHDPATSLLYFCRRSDIVRLFPSGGSIVLLESDMGLAAEMLKEYPDIRSLTLIVDLDAVAYKQVYSYLKMYAPRVTVLRLPSEKSHDMFSRGSLDLLYFGSSDAFSWSIESIEQWVHSVRPQGLVAGILESEEKIIGHRVGLETKILGHPRSSDGNTWYAIKPRKWRLK